MSARRTTLLLFLLFQALYALTSSGNVFRVPDEFEVYFQAEHLVDEGDLSVPQTLAIKQPVIVNGRVVGEQSMFFGEIGRDGRPYAPYGPLAAFLAVPHHLIGRAVARLAGVPRAPLPDGIPWLIVVGGLTMLATATAGALAVAGFHRAVRALGATPGDALVLALLLGGTTVLWPYSTSFFSESFQAAAFIWAAAFLIERRFVPAATLVALAGLTKMTSLVFAPAFAVAVAIDRSEPWAVRARVASLLALAILAAIGGHVLWNQYRFGHPFDFGYDWSETIPSPPARAFLPADIPRGLLVLLLTPGKSIVLWAPALLLSVFAFRRCAKAAPAVAVGVAVAASCGLLFYAAYLFPEGGYSHGPRNLVPILPLMLLPAAFVRVTRMNRAAVIAIAAVGAAVAILATSVSFLEDQSLGGDLTAGARTVYYERFDPPKGRVWNRYRIDYIPFVSTITEPGWLHAPTLGRGPDYFPLHLLQARQQLPGGAVIPLWLVWALPASWVALLGAAASGLRDAVARDSAGMSVHVEPAIAHETDERDARFRREVDRQR